MSNDQPRWTTLVELLRHRAQATPDRAFVRLLDASGEPGPWTTYAQLDAQARSIAAHLTDEGLSGERVLLVCPPGPSFVVAYFGCLYARATAVPCYPPGLTRASALALQAILRDSGARAVLCPRSWSQDGSQLRRIIDETGQSVRWLATELGESPVAFLPSGVRGDDLAFLQYTSGSTGSPKGVMVSHQNLVANLSTIERGFSLSESDNVCFWLPPYHDMGLIGGLLSAAYCGYPFTIMTPAQFVRAPLVWLKAISDLRITVTGAPNFAYDRCVQAARGADPSALQFDLSCLEIAFTGSEMVRADTLARFAETFAPYGFSPKSFMPCYGMAECTLLCSNSPRQAGAGLLGVDRDELTARERIVASDRADARSWNVVSCGKISPGVTVEIVDPEARQRRAEGQVGEIWIHSAGVAAGYWQREAISRETFDGRLAGDGRAFLRSGDRGFVRDGELYVVGRYKDIVIVRGRNLGAEDIEDSCRRAHASIQPQRCAAVVLDALADDSLAIVVECDLRKVAEQLRAEQLRAVVEAIRERLLIDHGIEPLRIVVVKSGEIPTTTSGKVQRRRCAQLLAEGGFTVTEQWQRAQQDRGAAVTAPASDDEVDAPADDSEATITLVCELIRKHARVRPTRHSRLRDLSIDSLKALEIVVELTDALGLGSVQPTLDPDLTVEQLVEHLRREAAAPAAGGAPASFVKSVAQSKPSLAVRIDHHRRELERLRQADVLNYNLTHERKLDATRSVLDGEELEIFSSYSYLGLSFHPEVIAAKVEAVTRHGSGAHGVMLLGGYCEEHEALERKLAQFVGAEAAVLYSSGYVANLAAIDSVVSAGGFIYCDMLVHTSIADGCRLSDAEVWMFPHQDASALEHMLAKRPAGAPALVIVDGVYSLRGEIAALPQLMQVAHRHGAMLLVDDAHALGAIGATGRGTAEHHHVLGQPDLITGGLGKAIPAYGGYVAGRREVIDYLRFRSRPYVYSGGMDVANVAAASKALDLLAEQPAIMHNLQLNIAELERLLDLYRIPSLRWGSPCAPVVCRDDREAYALSREMRRRGFYIAPIVYPAVPRDQQGLRLTVTAAHTTEQIHRCVRELDEAFRVVRQLELRAAAGSAAGSAAPPSPLGVTHE